MEEQQAEGGMVEMEKKEEEAEEDDGGGERNVCQALRAITLKKLGFRWAGGGKGAWGKGWKSGALVRSEAAAAAAASAQEGKVSVPSPAVPVEMKRDEHFFWRDQHVFMRGDDVKKKRNHGAHAKVTVCLRALEPIFGRTVPWLGYVHVGICQT